MRSKPAPAGESPPAVLENLREALGERGYVYSGLWHYSAVVAPQPTPYESAAAISAYGARLAELREAAEEEGIEWE